MGHLILHSDIYKEGVSYGSEEEFIKDIQEMDEDDLNWIEKQAKQFAGRLLIPVSELTRRIEEHEKQIAQIHQKYYGDDNAEELAIEGFSKKVCSDFEVLWHVIRNRIGYEKLTDKFVRE